MNRMQKLKPKLESPFKQTGARAGTVYILLTVGKALAPPWLEGGE